jgi:hypothetical protein
MANAQNDLPPVTDSPWFWALVFSVVGMAALAIICGKYGKRQAGIERQFQARERTAEQVAAVGEDGTIADKASQDVPIPQYSDAGRLLISIWPLFVVLSAVGVLAAIMLSRERKRFVNGGTAVGSGGPI